MQKQNITAKQPLTSRARRGIFPVLREQSAAADSLRAGVVPGSGVNSKHFLCLEILGVSVKHRPNYPVQGVCSTDRERPFYFRPGDQPMSVVNSNAAAVAESANFKGHIAPTGTITLPAPQVAPEIAGAGKSTEAKASKGASRDRMLELHKQQAELRAAGLMRTPLEKFLDDPRPLRAVRRFCYECQGYSAPAATACPVKTCPLWLFRRGSGVIREEEFAPWREAYRAWMERVGELATDEGGDPAEAEAATTGEE